MADSRSYLQQLAEINKERTLKWKNDKFLNLTYWSEKLKLALLSYQDTLKAYREQTDKKKRKEKIDSHAAEVILEQLYNSPNEFHVLLSELKTAINNYGENHHFYFIYLLDQLDHAINFALQNKPLLETKFIQEHCINSAIDHLNTLWKSITDEGKYLNSSLNQLSIESSPFENEEIQTLNNSILNSSQSTPHQPSQELTWLAKGCHELLEKYENDFAELYTKTYGYVETHEEILHVIKNLRQLLIAGPLYLLEKLKKCEDCITLAMNEHPLGYVHVFNNYVKLAAAHAYDIVAAMDIEQKIQEGKYPKGASKFTQEIFSAWNTTPAKVSSNLAATKDVSNDIRIEILKSVIIDSENIRDLIITLNANMKNNLFCIEMLANPSIKKIIEKKWPKTGIIKLLRGLCDDNNDENLKVIKSLLRDFIILPIKENQYTERDASSMLAALCAHGSRKVIVPLITEYFDINDNILENAIKDFFGMAAFDFDKEYSKRFHFDKEYSKIKDKNVIIDLLKLKELTPNFIDSFLSTFDKFNRLITSFFYYSPGRNINTHANNQDMILSVLEYLINHKCYLSGQESNSNSMIKNSAAITAYSYCVINFREIYAYFKNNTQSETLDARGKELIKINLMLIEYTLNNQLILKASSYPSHIKEQNAHSLYHSLAHIISISETFDKELLLTILKFTNHGFSLDNLYFPDLNTRKIELMHSYFLYPMISIQKIIREIKLTEENNKLSVLLEKINQAQDKLSQIPVPGSTSLTPMKTFHTVFGIILSLEKEAQLIKYLEVKKSLKNIMSLFHAKDETPSCNVKNLKKQYLDILTEATWENYLSQEQKAELLNKAKNSELVNYHRSSLFSLHTTKTRKEVNSLLKRFL